MGWKRGRRGGFGVAAREVRVADENRGESPMDPPIEKVDDLFWLRDDTRKDEEILGLLREENEYTASRTAHLEGARASLYDEMISHLQEDDDTYPAPSSDGYDYCRDDKACPCGPCCYCKCTLAPNTTLPKKNEIGYWKQRRSE